MYERLQGPDDLIAIRLGETLTSADIAQLYAEVEGALARHGRLNYYVDASRWSHMGLEAGLESVKQRLSHLGWLTRFDRVAVVTDSAAVKAMVTLMDALLPAMTLRAFQPAESEAGLAWAKGG